MRIIATTIVAFMFLCFSAQAQDASLSEDERGRIYIEDARAENQSYQQGKFMSIGTFADHVEETIPSSGIKLGGDAWTGENFLRGSGMVAAGDVNADGTANFIQSRANIPNLNTADLEDYRSVSYLYLDDLSTITQTFEGVSDILPVGDLNGDGNNDALFVYEDDYTELHLFTGSSAGYEDASLSYTFNEPVENITSGNFDRNDSDDVILYDVNRMVYLLTGNSTSTDNIELIELNTSSNLAYLRAFELNQEDYLAIVGVADGIISMDFGWFDTNNEFVSEQSLSFSAGLNEFAFTDIDGDQNLDIVYTDNTTVFAFMDAQMASKSSGNVTQTNHLFETTPTELGTIDLPYEILGFLPDMNGDGSGDLLIADNNVPQFLLNGADLVSNGFVEGNLIDFGESENPYNGFFLPENRTSPSEMYNELGDVTGNGDSDLVMLRSNLPDSLTVDAISGISAGSKTVASLNAPLYEVDHEAIYTDNAGDWDGDGVDDFGYIYNTFRSEGSYYQIDLSGGGNLKFELGSESNYFRVPEFADLNGDGSPEMILALNRYENDVLVNYQAVYSASSSNPTERVAFDKLTDIFTDVNNPRILSYVNIGDVTGDDRENVVALTSGDLFDSKGMYLVSQTGGGYQYNLINARGNFAANIGDINQDGIDDFAVNDFFTSEIRFFHGVDNPGAAETFSQVDGISGSNVATHTSSNFVFFGVHFAAGDFTGDGNIDIAASPFYSYDSQGSNEGGEILFLFEGHDDGSIETEVPSEAIKVETDVIDPLRVTFAQENDYAYLVGNLQTLPDLNGDGSDELLVTSQIGSNAVLIMGRSTMSLTLDEEDNPELQMISKLFGETVHMLEAPNRTTRLGLSGNFINVTYHSATGDFNDDGVMEAVLPQPYDGNYQVTPSYNYNLDVPSYEEPTLFELTSIEDVENDQGGWVRLNIDGEFFSENMYESWSIFRKDSAEKWVHVKTIPRTMNAASYAEVAVPHTLANGEEPDSTNSYEFRVTMNVFPDAEFEDQGEHITITSDEERGWALDNLAPSKVDGFNGSLNGDQVMLTWNESSANDLQEYSVFEVVDGSFDADNPLLTTSETSATVSAAELQTSAAEAHFVVKAMDIHNNASEVSDQIEVDISTSADELNAKVPADYDLKQNYPNPFNPSTKIQFDLPEAADVKITVFNLLGEQVTTLLNSRLNAGEHTVEFNANRLSSGTYIYRMQTSTGFSDTRKLTLIK